MRMTDVSLTIKANSLAVNKNNGTCVEILSMYMFNGIKYVTFIKPGSSEAQKLTMKEFHYIYSRVNAKFLNEVLVPAYNMAIQKQLVTVSGNTIDGWDYQVDHNAINK